MKLSESRGNTGDNACNDQFKSFNGFCWLYDFRNAPPLGFSVKQVDNSHVASELVSRQSEN